ncbi:cytochrome c [Candidatus Pelagibacter sp.]|nr:cytochrome c [Candidatus Pelagibacter sp.]
MKKKLIKIRYFILVIFVLFLQGANADDLFDKGKKIFLGDSNCATCHTLQDANSNGNIGPNLDMLKPDMVRVISAVTNGIGVMPAYEGQLSTEEIQAVANYVAESTN